MSSSLSQRIHASRPQTWQGLMLLALHAALGWGIDDLWSRAFLLAHVGLFLIWQPLWRGEHDLQPAHAALVVGIGAVLAGFTNWWLMAIWLAVLFGLIGGNLPGMRERGHRLTSMLSAIYLLAMLLIWVVPHLFGERSIDPAMELLARYGLVVLPCLIVAIRVEGSRSSAPLAVDLFYSMLLFLMVAALVLGSFVVREFSRSNYPMALAQTLVGIAVLLVALSWLWNPHGGFSGLGQLLSRYLLSMGLPFERWMQDIAVRAEQDIPPDAFLSEAVHSMLELPWVAGVEWRTKAGAGSAGDRAEFHAPAFTYRELTLTIYTRWSLSPALLLHLKLLTRLLAYFYDSKRREQLQRQNAYTQAIYETGARLTHDVKNLLQSLKSLCAAAEASGPERATELQALIQRQLPQITQRLQVTLDKLRAPAQGESASYVEAARWWESLKSRYGRSAIVFASGSVAETRLPGELFDSVADNLLQNALNKGHDQPSFRVEVALTGGERPELSVADNGHPVAPAVASQLFDAPVPSHTGLGIGLYQAAKQAARLGFRLTLVENEQGRVRFNLSPDS